MSCRVVFSVSCRDVERGEEKAVMCITGNCEELGNWEPDRVVRMVQESNQENRHVWTSELDLLADTNISYRYALCSFVKCGEDEKVVIHRWETALNPRSLVTEGATLCRDEETFGTYDGTTCLDRGWLTAQSEIQLLIHGRPLTLQGNSTNGIAPFGFKVTARHEKPVATENGESSTSSKKQMKNYDVLPVFMSVLNEKECEPCVQPDNGKCFNTDDIVIYSVQTFSPESLSFKVEILSSVIEGDSNRNEVMGVATILGRNIGCSTRFVPVIDSDMDTLGTLEVHCTLVRPMQADLCNFEVSFSRYWNKARPCLEVGHRGMGRSLVDHSLLVEINATSDIPENTIKSLQEALKHGADMVEFDIHVTKDRVPVIGHDFQAILNAASDHGSAFNLGVPINYLNLRDIDKLKTGQCLALEHTEGSQSRSCPGSPSKAPLAKEMQLFPTLQFALDEVDPDLGFQMEVKYPMDIVNGDKEMPCEKIPLQRNFLVDAILDITLKYAGHRRIVFSAFDPYVCIMLRLKQNKYPVLYANFGPSELYEIYEGPLCTGIEVSSLLARSIGLLGLSSHSLDLLRYPDLAEKCNTDGLVHFCWGEDNNNVEKLKTLKAIPVQGAIHDSLGKYPDNRENIFQREKKTTRSQEAP